MRTLTTRLDPGSTPHFSTADSDDGWLAACNRFWFAPADPTPLGLMRICTGVLVIYLHLVYAGCLQTYFGENAWENLKAANWFRNEARYPYPGDGWANEEVPSERNGAYVWSLWYHVTNPTWMALITAGMLIVMVMFTAGFCTRVTSVLTWMSAMCFIQRSWSLLYGVDTMMNLALIYLMIGPCGDALSVDRWISRWWTARQSGLPLGPAPAPAPSVWANFILRLVQINFCIIYLASGSSKLQGRTWWNGSALWGCMANPEFAPLHLAAYASFINWLSENRWAWEIVLTSGAVFTLALELGFPFLVWNRRLRPVMIVGAIMLHLGIAVIMGLITFSLFMFCLLLAFVPGEAIRHGTRIAVDWLRGKDLPAKKVAVPARELTMQRR
jgi:hypothetical protein